MKHPRCCNRFTYWRVPFGPWVCSRCDREWPADDVPAAHLARFWAAIDELVRLVDRVAATNPDALVLLDLFKGKR